jgi:hypothetical protein
MDAPSLLDTQGQSNVTELIEKLRAKDWIVGSTDYADYAGGAGNERHRAWLFLTDRRCRTLVGLSIFDLSDAACGDFYQNGISPVEGFRAGLDTHSAPFGG